MCNNGKSAAGISSPRPALLGTVMRITYCGLEGWGIVTAFRGPDAGHPQEITVRTKTRQDITVPATDAKPETAPAILLRAEQLKREWWGVPNATRQTAARSDASLHADVGLDGPERTR